VIGVFLVELDATLRPAQPMSDDDLTDLIEVIVDELDHLPVEPSVGSVRRGDEIELTVGVVVEDDGSIDAMTHGLAVIKAAFHAAKLDTSDLGVPAAALYGLTSRVSEMQLVG
jgi:hypothetical protein